MNWKWIGVVALYVIGILAAVVAIWWLAVPFHSLPAFIGGKHGRGRYQRRGEGLIVFAVIVLGIAIYLTVRFRRAGATTGAPAAVSDAPKPAAFEQTPGPAGSPASEQPGTIETPVDKQ